MSVKIVIVGAGAAGLAAATKLYESGLTDFVILEANDRIGGRIWTVPFGDNVIDLGAQFCHGQKHNVVFELAGPLNLLEESLFSKRNVLVFSNGSQAPVDVTDRMMHVANQLMEADYIRSSSSENCILGEYFVKNFRQILSQQKDFQNVEETLVDDFITFYHNYLKGYLAVDSWNSLTMAEVLDYEECEGFVRQNWKGKGFDSILQLLMKQHPAQSCSAISLKDKILFNKRVMRISRDNTANMIIKCEDNSEYSAESAVITVSLGVLKQMHASIFSPPLPDVNVNAIEGLHFGTVNKAFLEFPEAFWIERGNVFRLVWCESDLDELRSSRYSWTEGVSTFFGIDDYPNVLAAWLVGPEGRQTENLADDDIKEGLLMLLRKFFSGCTIPEPNRFIRSKWNSDPSFLGSYSCRSLETEKLKTGAKDLSTPVTGSGGKPVLLFAGEATSPTHWSTVHGAIESGWREADRLIQWYQY
ncbi:AAEL009050-PA [Aedes aegypti]|uniref:AAEL009050-PA n=1 Tax=Aedes aegypti TaxID=7159 RepID=Q16WZ4_AEDAE|nr:AAEL009050-PA [Aedes aegypti]